MSSNNPTPVLVADKLYEAYDRFVCKECAGMTAEYTGVTIGGYRLTVITTADVVEWAGYDQGPLTCECRRLEAVLDEQQQLQIRPGTPLPRPAAGAPADPAPASYPVTAMTLTDVVEDIRLLLDAGSADVDGITADADPHPALDPAAAIPGESAVLVTTPTVVTARCPDCNSPVSDAITYFGVHTASCTLVMCQCEHADHEHPATSHPYLGVRAGTHRAQHVGLVCDECAAGHLAGYLLDDPTDEDGPR